MKGLIRNIIIIFFTTPLLALKNDPWIPSLFEFNGQIGYAYSYFPSVANTVSSENYSSFVNELGLELNGSVTPNLFLEVEVEFDNSRKVDFNLLSVAPAVKYQCLNDLTGDAVALLVGTYFRYVPSNRLVDVATPYSGEYNFDFLASIGKEFDNNKNFVGNAYAMFDVGIATVGMPWILADILAEAVFKKNNYFRLGVDGFFGFGDQKEVDVNNFRGYAKIYHQSLNVKVGYGYKFPVWGEISFLYKRRVIAIAYPSDLDYFGIQYNVSFSF